MNKFKIITYYILLSVILNSSYVHGQSIDTNKHYYQDQLDYLPHFQIYRLAGENCLYRPGLEFNKVLEEILNSCSEIKYTLLSHFGEWSSMSGISPIGISKDSYFVLELDEYGKVDRLDIYNANNSDQIKQCLLKALEMSKINPGLKRLQPVKCYFVYIFK